jgi:PPOX class probable F420-dependent enzyme
MPNPPIPDAARDLLNAGRLAHLVTTDPDGAPHVTCVWVEAGEREVIFAGIGAKRYLSNIERDPRVAISVAAGRRDDRQVEEYLVVRGRASVSEGGAGPLLHRLAQIYQGAGSSFAADVDPAVGAVIHIAPERFGGNGPWTGR